MEFSKEVVLTFLAVMVVLLVGLLTDLMAWAISAGLLVWIAYNTLEYRKVRRWSEKPLRRPFNGSDLWFPIAYRPYRSLLRQRQRTRQMAARVRQILRLVEFLPDGVIVLDATGAIEAMNAPARQFMGLDERDLGLGLRTVVRSPEFVEFLRRSDLNPPLEFTSPADHDATLEARRFDIEFGGQVVLLRDITPLNRLLTVRQQFVANVSHELRTPLTVLRGYIETMSDPQEPIEEKLQLLAKLSRPVRRMQSLVDDLLLLTQIESTSDEPVGEFFPVDLAAIARDVIHSLEPQAIERIRFDTQGKTTIMGDAQQLHSVFGNLIDNALKYSADDTVVHVRVRENPEHDHVQISVEDSGVGIPREHINRLTERFYRVDMAQSRAQGGTGLGLAIVKHILRRHQSVIEIESELGVGSRFFCSFAPYPDTVDNHQEIT